MVYRYYKYEVTVTYSDGTMNVLDVFFNKSEAKRFMNQLNLFKDDNSVKLEMRKHRLNTSIVQFKEPCDRG